MDDPRGLRWLLLQDEGRIGRKTFWLYGAFFVPFGLGLIYKMLAPFDTMIGIGFRSELIYDGKTDVVVAGPFNLLIALAQYWFLYCIRAKRFQDFGLSKQYQIVWTLADFALTLAVYVAGHGKSYVLSRPFEATGLMLQFAAITVPALGMVLICGCIPGTRGPNRYGPDPQGAVTS